MLDSWAEFSRRAGRTFCELAPDALCDHVVALPLSLLSFHLFFLQGLLGVLRFRLALGHSDASTPGQ